MPDHADSTPILFKDHTSTDLHARLAPLGVTARLARRLQAAVLQRGATGGAGRPAGNLAAPAASASARRRACRG